MELLTSFQDPELERLCFYLVREAGEYVWYCLPEALDYGVRSEANGPWEIITTEAFPWVLDARVPRNGCQSGTAPLENPHFLIECLYDGEYVSVAYSRARRHLC